MKKLILIFLVFLFCVNLVSCNNQDEKIEIADVKVAQKMELLGNVKRTKPLVSNEGLEKYPEYGKYLELTNEEKKAILAENDYLRASQGSYDSMDSEGNLYKDDKAIGRKLYKHTAAENMYYGNLSDEEQAVVKKISIEESREYGNYITGLYAPAGEVIKIEISEEDLEKTGGIDVHIGQISSRGVVNNIWLEKGFNRMPVIANVMKITKPISYVGYHLGGPIYIGNGLKNNKVGYSVTISGAVPYQHYIMGLTSKEEYEKNSKSTAPYFDLEIWDDGVRHSGPNMVSSLNYNEISNAADLWYKISTVSNNIPTGSIASIGIDFLYDPFVAAGAAVAFVGRNFTNLPPSWMISSLNYDEFVEQGAWGTIHEYNHHFQRYGFAPGDEVTNNAISLISYILFTNISSHRNIDDSYLSGWNRFTDPSRSLRETLEATKTGTPNQSLSAYANILHSFGPKIFIDAARYGAGKGGVDKWYESLCESTHYDMTYYFETILNQKVSDEIKNTIKAKPYPMYVPIATIYQTGVNYYFDGNEHFANTVKPYKIKYGTSETIDFTKCLILPEDVSFEVLQVSKPKSGKIVAKSNNIYEYVPGKDNNSGKIEVELKLIKKDNEFSINNVKLILEFVQEEKGLEVTTYKYNNETMYRNIAVAEANSFSGNEEISKANNKGNRIVFNENNTISVIEGKIYIPRDGNYTISAIGKDNIFVYLGKSRNDLKLAITIDGHKNRYSDNDANEYAKFNCKEGEYVYFKAVVRSVSNDSYFELGWKQQEENYIKIPDKYLINPKLKYNKNKFKSNYFIYELVE